jgi:hypothetical protein
MMSFLVPSTMYLWPVLMPDHLGLPKHEYTIRPWVKTGHPAMPILANAANTVAPAITTPSTAVSGATIRVVDSSLDSASIYSSYGIEAPAPRDAPTSSDRDTPTPTLTGRHSRTPKSLSFRGKDRSTPSRSRGMTVPADRKQHTPERQRTKDRESDRDSIASFTPSMSSKHLANWFSGLLGR